MALDERGECARRVSPPMTKGRVRGTRPQSGAVGHDQCRSSAIDEHPSAFIEHPIRFRAEFETVNHDDPVGARRLQWPLRGFGDDRLIASVAGPTGADQGIGQQIDDPRGFALWSVEKRVGETESDNNHSRQVWPRTVQSCLDRLDHQCRKRTGAIETVHLNGCHCHCNAVSIEPQSRLVRRQ